MKTFLYGVGDSVDIGKRQSRFCALLSTAL